MSTLPAITDCSSFLSIGFDSSPALLTKKSAVLKHIAQSEHLVAVRPASRLEVRPRPEMVSTGIPELDALTGGIPRGGLTEICGGHSSGKTSVLVAALSAATQREESCVLIDASDSFDPRSGAAAGIDFRKLLWVRCRNSSSVVRRPSSSENQSLAVGPWSLAKNSRDRVPAPSALFAEEPALSLSKGVNFDFAYDGRTTDAEFPDDRRPFLACPERAERVKGTDDYNYKSRNYHERRLEQVLKSTDLILQSGGFGLVALDLAGIPEKFVRRIPLASWFRFQRAVEHTQTALLVLGEIACAQTCAALVMRVWNQASGVRNQGSGKPSHVDVLKEMLIEAKIIRSRLVHNENRKPMQSIKTNFSTHTVRAG